MPIELIFSNIYNIILFGVIIDLNYIFEIKDKSGRLIHLTNERWNEHIKIEHPDIVELDEIINILKNPDSLIIGDEKHYYYKYYKNRKSKSRYLKIVVKYLNGSGFVITIYYMRDIRKNER